MTKYLLLFICLLSPFGSTCFSQEFNKKELYHLTKANTEFNHQNFEACLQNVYLCIYYSKLHHDSVHLSEYWFEIACLNVLLNNYSVACNDLSLSQHYTQSQPLINNRKLLVNGLNYYNHLNYKLAKDNFEKSDYNVFQINHLYQLVNIYKAYCCEELNHEVDHKILIAKELEKLKHLNDTAWFGFPVCQYLTGYTFYLRSLFSSDTIYFKAAIQNFEKNSIKQIDLIKSYRYLLNSYQLIHKNSYYQLYRSKLDAVLLKIHHIPEMDFHLDIINANEYYFNKNFKDEISTCLKILNSPHSDSIKSYVAKRIFITYALSHNPSAALKYFDMISENDKKPYENAVAGRCYNLIGNPVIANSLIKKSERKINSTDRNYETSLIELSSYYSDIKHYANQKRKLYQCLEHTSKIPNRLDFRFFEIYIQLGLFYWNIHDFQMAVLMYHKATYSLLNTEYRPNPYNIPDISKSIDDFHLDFALNGEAESLYSKSKKCKTKAEELRNLKISLDYFELDMQIIHRHTSTLPFEEQKLMNADLCKRQYPNIIKVCLELFNKTGDSLYAEKAFEYVEKSKASLLLSLIRGIQMQKTNLLPKYLVQKEEYLRTTDAILTNTINQMYQQTTPDYVEITKITNKKNQISKSQDSLNQLFKTTYPTYYESKFKEQVTSTKILQTKLPDNEALIQYSLTSNFMVTYVLTKHIFKIFTDTVNGRFFDDVAAYHQKTTTYNFNDSHFASIASFSEVSNRLYRHLIQPAEKYIKNKKLIIIPDDVLNQIPFETLVSEIPSKQNTNYKQLHYLLRDHSISYNFSGTLYGLNLESAAIKQTSVLGMAPEYSDVHETSLQIKAPVNHNNLRFSTIAGTNNEVASIQQFFPQARIIKNKATEKQFKAVSGDYDIIHLAMHGVVNNENPMFSKLIFAPEYDSINEGYLNTYEIYNMHLNASLVVLSACNSGSGKLHTGEGIISLARGFFSAGAKSVVMTLWSVADKSSSWLMKSFYSKLASGQNIGDALQSSKLNFLDQTDVVSSHPYFWAGYIATGNTNLVFKPQQSRRWIYYSITGILILIITVILGRKYSIQTMLNHLKPYHHKT